MLVSISGLVVAWLIAGVVNAAAPDEASKAAVQKLLEQHGLTNLEIGNSEKEMDNRFIRDVVKPRHLQDLTLACETEDPEFDGVVCVLVGYPTQGFTTGLAGCPIGTELTQDFFLCAFCFVFAGDAENDEVCDLCSQCANNDIGYDCTNLATGDCASYSCLAGLCGQTDEPPETPAPTPRPTPTPTQAQASSGDGGFCFSGETTVQHKSGQVVQMKDLQLGDEILTPSGEYSKVYSFGHRHENTTAEFLTFLPWELEISPNHLLFLVDGRAVPASMVHVGDKLLGGGEVTGIETVLRQGVYAPFTVSGDLVLNTVGVSSFVGFSSTSATFLSISYHSWAYWFEWPHRMYCSVFSECLEETYDAKGINPWVAGGLQGALWLHGAEQFGLSTTN